jgi:formylglycine-generating enzyme required for sulfatase activity/phosphodiesterase/alkaline phosphatase D-like protein
MLRFRALVGPTVLLAGSALLLTLLSPGCGPDKPPTPDPLCNISPDTLQFGSVALGASAELDFVIGNAGGKTLSGNVTENSAQFSLVSGQGVFALAAGQSATVRVRYSPTTRGAHTGRIETGLAGSCSVVTLGYGLGDSIRPARVTPLATIGATAGSITLSWTSVGDDSLSGTASLYDVRYSTSPMTEANWGSATQAEGEPAPKASGQPESFAVTGLDGSTTYHFALKVRDEVDEPGHWSALSDVAAGTTQDIIRPAPVLDLTAGSPTASSISLTWTAVGDDSLSGTATIYNIRYSTNVGSTWAAATPVSGLPMPLPSGGHESFIVSGLSSDTEYFFWIQVGDEVPNWSRTTGPASAKTPDVTPPAPVQDLRVASTDVNSMTLNWTAVGDDGNTGQASVYDVRFSTTPNAIWESMRQATGEPTPRPAGETETFTVNGTLPNTWYYFRLKVEDEVPNRSPESIEAAGKHDTMPPSAVTDLTCVSSTGSTVTLTWTAPGNDGTDGTAATYDLRYSTDCGAVWVLMTQVVGEPGPKPAGQTETFTVTGLSSDTMYCFVLKTADGAVPPNISAESNRAGYKTVDVTPPASITTLVVSCVNDGNAVLTWKSTGDDGNVGTASWYDLRYSTVSGASYELMTRVIGVPAPKTAGSDETYTVHNLLPNTTYYFLLKIGDEVINWSDVSNVGSCGTPDTVPPRRIIDLSSPSASGTSVTLSWTATGDDSLTGTATTYDIRYSANAGVLWDQMAQAAGEPAPRSSGQTETFTVGGLHSGTNYRFAMKVADEVPNWSTLSNEITVPTHDVVRPGPIGDLSAAPSGSGTGMTLTWTAVGDDSLSSTATTYDIRYSTNAGAAWDGPQMTPATGEPHPAAPGQIEHFTINGLNPSRTYYFRMKTADEVPNWSAESNEVHGAPDAIRPAPVGNLRVGVTTLSSIQLLWTAVGDDSLTGTAAAYDMRMSFSAITDANWDLAGLVPGLHAPKAVGLPETLLVSGLTNSSTYHFRLQVRDDAGNLSALSDEAVGSTNDVIRPYRVTDLRAGATTDHRVLLSWTATGDDSLTGRASSYVVRYGTSPTMDWSAMSDAPGEPVPSDPGMVERFVVTAPAGLPPILVANTTYYFRVKVLDEVPNSSAESNQAAATTAPVGLAWIPGGEVRLGQDGIVNAPTNDAVVDTFYISLTEVTTAQYKAFMDAAGYTTEALWDAVGWTWKNANTITAPAGWYTGGSPISSDYLHNNPNLGGGTYPVQGVSWWEARAYARWAGLRLPTEAEWEMAAKGGCEVWGLRGSCDPQDTPTYPWGEGISGSRANYLLSDDPYEYDGRTSPVGFFDGLIHGGFITVASPSPYGCYDNAGNLGEWCHTKYAWYPYSALDGREALPATYNENGRVVRGGSWNSADVDPRQFRCAARDSRLPDARLPEVGFRCAKNKH